MLRVLFISHSASLDGATKVLANLVSAFEQDSVRPLVILPEDGPIVDVLGKADVSYRIVNIGHLGWDLHHVPMLQLLFREEKPDCIHANTTVSYPAVLAGRLAGIPVVWHIHEMFSHREYYPLKNLDERLLPELISGSDRVCVPSDAAKEAFSDYGNHIGVEGKIQVVHYGVILPEEARPPDTKPPFVISAIGNFVPVKGFNYLVEAFADLVQDHPRVELQIVGKIFLEQFLLLYKMAEESGVLDRIRFLTETRDIQEIYLRSHMIVCSSIIETLPMVVLEALSYGKPVVATRVGGIPELVQDRVTGLLVPPKDSAALANAIRWYLDNWDEALQMGNRARLLVSEEFSLAAQARKFTAVYRDLAKEKINATTAAFDVNVLKGILYDHMVRESEKIYQIQKHLEELRLHVSADSAVIANVIRDLRTLESVVSNLLNRWPFKLARSLKRLLIPKKQ